MLHNFLEFISTNYLNYQTKLTFSKAFNQAIAKTFFNAETFRELLPNITTYFFQNLYQSMLISSESNCQIIPTFLEFISNQTNIYRELLPNNGRDFFQTLYQAILSISELIQNSTILFFRVHFKQ